MGTVLVLYPSFGLLDPWIASAFMGAWLVRGLIVFQCIVLLLLTRSSLFQRMHQLILLILPALGGLGILLIVMLADDTVRQLYYAGLILATIWTVLIADVRITAGSAAGAWGVGRR